MERLTKISKLLSFALRTNYRKSTDQNITGNYFKFIANCKFYLHFFQNALVLGLLNIRWNVSVMKVLCHCVILCIYGPVCWYILLKYILFISLRSYDLTSFGINRIYRILCNLQLRGNFSRIWYRGCLVSMSN